MSSYVGVGTSLIHPVLMYNDTDGGDNVVQKNSNSDDFDEADNVLQEHAICSAKS